MQTETQREYETTIQAAVRLLQSRLDDPPGFRELAEKACLSPYHFHRIFRAMVGESPNELTRRLRLERAAWWLRSTEKAIVEVALSSGYATHEAFTKAFRTGFRCTPTEYRCGKRNCGGIASECSVHFDRGHFTPLRFVYQLRKAGLTMHLEIVTLPEYRIAAVTHIGPYNQIGDAFGRLASIAGPLGLFASSDPTPYQVGIYLDDPETVPPEQLKSIAGVYVPEGANIGELEEVRQPAGKYLQATHEGSYALLGKAWSVLYGELIPGGEYSLREGPCFEVYVSADHTAPADELRTYLCVPVQ